MTLRIFAAVAVVFLATPVQSQTQITSGNYQIQGCRELLFGRVSGETAFRAGWCVGAVSAIADVAPSVCTPSGVTADQAARVVVTYLDQKPAKLNENFYKLAVEALQAAWPCHKR